MKKLSFGDSRPSASNMRHQEDFNMKKTRGKELITTKTLKWRASAADERCISATSASSMNQWCGAMNRDRVALLRGSTKRVIGGKFASMFVHILCHTKALKIPISSSYIS
jgi:hypothetical protein